MTAEAPIPAGASIDVLHDLERWVVWRWEEDSNGRPTKPPYTKGGRHASTTNPTTWMSRTEACAIPRMDGIGLVLTQHPNLAALDLDDCRNDTDGEITDWARELVEAAGSYTEITPSGRGLRVLGVVPEDAPEMSFIVPMNPANPHEKVEVYVHARRYVAFSEILWEELPTAHKGLNDISHVVEHLRRLKARATNGSSQRADPGPDPDLDRLPPDLQDLIRTGVPKGYRSNAMLKAVAGMRRAGFTYEEIVRVLRRHRTGIGAKCFDGGRDRVDDHVRRILKKLEAEERAKEKEPDGDIVPIPAPTLAELADQPEIERRFLDGGQRIPMRNVTLLSGDGGTGKSLVALQLALAASAGKLVSPPLPWLGADLWETGVVVYVAAEDEGLEVRRRLAQMCQQAGIDPRAVDRLHIVSLAEEADTTLAIEERGVLKPTPLYRRIEARLALIPAITLIVVDNAADVFGASEIVRHLVRAFISLWRGTAIRRDCAVLMLFHPSQAGLRDGSGTSGSTGWHNSVKSRLYLERIRDETGQEPDQDRRRLRAMKANYAPLGEDIELVYDQGQFVATAVVRPFDGVTVGHLDQVKAAFAPGTYRVSPQSAGWGGFLVADLLGLEAGRSLKVAELNPDEKKNRRRVGTILAQWIRAKEICTVRKRDERRHMTSCYGVRGVTRDDD